MRYRALQMACLLLAACTSGGSSPTTPAPTAGSSSTATAPAATAPSSTTTPPLTATTVPATSRPQPFVAVAWEPGGELGILVPTETDGGCPELGQPLARECGALTLRARYEVPAGPHNVATSAGLVVATHPAAGMLSVIDVATGVATSSAVGTEPHDVKFVAEDTVVVADEEGRRLLTVKVPGLEVVGELALPERAHDLYVTDDGIWVTLIGREEFALVDSQGGMELIPTGGRSPHDLVVDTSGLVWFSNWNSDELAVLDPASGEATSISVGVDEPHHFSAGPDGTVWVTDNGGQSVVRFAGPRKEPVAVAVGLAPHHIGMLGDLVIVAVYGDGEVVAVQGDLVVGRVPIGSGLHGVGVGYAPSVAG